MSLYCLLVLHDFTFIEHYFFDFFDKISILYHDSPSFRKIVGTETAEQFQR